MMTVYGSPLCPDCTAMQEVFAAHHIDYDYINITESTANLRTFLALRDHEPALRPARENGSIGIPCFVLGERITLDPEEALAWVCPKADTAD